MKIHLISIALLMSVNACKELSKEVPKPKASEVSETSECIVIADDSENIGFQLKQLESEGKISSEERRQLSEYSNYFDIGAILRMLGGGFDLSSILDSFGGGIPDLSSLLGGGLSGIGGGSSLGSSGLGSGNTANDSVGTSPIDNDSIIDQPLDDSINSEIEDSSGC